MADAKTVDNLPPDVNNSYMRAMELLGDAEVRKLTQSPNIAKRAEILKTALKPLEIDELFGLKESGSSPFEAPPNFVLATDIFTYQLVPTLGPLNELIEKLETLEAKKKKKKKDEDEDSEEERQRKRLLKFATMMTMLNTILTDIKKRKDEYHKG